MTESTGVFLFPLIFQCLRFGHLVVQSQNRQTHKRNGVMGAQHIVLVKINAENFVQGGEISDSRPCRTPGFLSPQAFVG